MKLTLPASIASLQDIAALTADIRTYGSWLSRQLIKQKVSSSAPAAPQPAISPEATAIIQSATGKSAPTPATIDTLLAELEQYKANAPTVTITLAGVPSGDVKQRLVGWFRSELDPDMLVSFKLNRAILGGMVVTYGSHIYDWSFRRKLLEAKRPFHEVLADV